MRFFAESITDTDSSIVTGACELDRRRRQAGRPEAMLGGITVDEERRHAVVISTLDNLLKGAASQAAQNLNLAFGFPETTGILPWPSP